MVSYFARLAYCAYIRRRRLFTVLDNASLKHGVPTKQSVTLLRNLNRLYLLRLP